MKRYREAEDSQGSEGDVGLWEPPAARRTPLETVIPGQRQSASERQEVLREPNGPRRLPRGSRRPQGATAQTDSRRRGSGGLSLAWDTPTPWLIQKQGPSLGKST